MHTPPSPMSQETQAINERLDRLPVITRTHKTWIALLGFLFTFDLVDLNTFAYTAPALRAEWGLSIGVVGAVTSASFFGMFVGGLLGGRLADTYGRRPLIITAAFFFSGCSLLSAVSPNVEVLAVSRVLTGMGLQAMTGVLLVYVSEMFPRHKRGRYQSLMLALGLVGVPIAAAVSRLIVPIGDGTWRWVYVIGAAGAIGAVIAIRKLPESARWQAANGKAAEAEVVLDRLESETRAVTGRDLPPPVKVAAVAESNRVRDLFSPRYIKRTTVISVVMVCLILAFYGFNSWIPTLLVERGYTETQSLTYSLILSIAAVPGALLAWPVVDRWERKNLLMGITGVIAVLLLAFGFVSDVALMLGTGFLITMLLQMMTAVLYTYLPEIFPTPLRGLGSGFANSLGRLAGVAGGFIVASVYSGLGYTAVFGYLAVTVLLLGSVLAAFGERTTNRRLEEVTAG